MIQTYKPVLLGSQKNKTLKIFTSKHFTWKDFLFFCISIEPVIIAGCKPGSQFSMALQSDF